MRITIRFFAILKDRTGVPQAEIDVSPNSTVAAALEAIANRFVLIRNDLSRVAVAVNRNYAKPDTIIHDGDELALIPPVSGG